MVPSYRKIKPSDGLVVLYEFEKRIYEGIVIGTLNETVYTVVSMFGETHIVPSKNIAPKPILANYFFFIARWDGKDPEIAVDLMDMYRGLSKYNKEYITRMLNIAKMSDNGFAKDAATSNLQAPSSY